MQVQLWLWFILPLLLVLVALTLTSAYSNQGAIRDLTAEHDLAMARLYARQIEDALTRGIVLSSGQGLAHLIGDARVGQQGIVYVVDDGYHILFHPDPAQVGIELPSNSPLRQLALSDTGTVSAHLADGSPTLASFAPVGKYGWRVVVEEPLPAVITSLLHTSSTLPILLVAAGFLSLLIIDFSLHTIVRPLRNLAEAATRITWGELPSLQQDIGGVEEIRQLQHALYDMVERIRSYQESMRGYVEAITQGQETERARLSRELHDQTVQDLIATSQRLQLAQHAVERGDTRVAQDILQQTYELTQGTLDELRRLIRALRPIYLEDLGFIPALEMLVQETRAAELNAEILVEGEPRRLPPATELAAFRMVQEALANAIQHAKAQQIVLTVSFGKNEVTLTVEDDGAGFVMPDAAHALIQAGHLGLAGMRERVLLAGGRLEIQSRPGIGTRVTARFPV